MRVAYTRRTSACPVQRLYSVLPYVLRGSKKILFIDVPLYHPLGVVTFEVQASNIFVSPAGTSKARMGLLLFASIRSLGWVLDSPFARSKIAEEEG